MNIFKPEERLSNLLMKFYITTPIYYVNDRPHLGHAYTTIAADVLARYHRQKGDEVFFLVGSDEHGAKIEEAAKESGYLPQVFCDQKVKTFKKAWQSLNIDYDNFIRTSSQIHKSAVKKTLQILWDKGFIYKGYYQGLYCRGCEQYKTEDDLVKGLCPFHQKKPELLKEKSYFFKLSQFQDELIKKISKNEFLIEPEERKNEVLSFIKRGLKDISISRQKVKWGIPLPFDKKQTTYVWIDAFLNYLTGLGWDGDPAKILPRAKSRGKNLVPNLQFWPPDLQLMAKDILRVHGTIWPGLLLALNIDLPKKLFIHGFFTINGQKMSKSLGNIIWPEELVKKFGVDGTRYLLISIAYFGQDGDISWQRLTEKYNADLANGLGNLLSRVVKLNQKLTPYLTRGKNQKYIPNIKNNEIQKLFDEVKLKEILDQIWQQIAWANKYIEKKKLWELVKDKKEEAKKILIELLSLITEISETIKPFMPETSERIFKIIESGQIKKPLFPKISG